MESIEPVWLFGAMMLLTGILLGLLITRLFNKAPGDIEKLKAELEYERAAMETYKASVNTHFDETSDLVNELTQDYVKVYRHLAEGAQTLSNTREFTQVLEQPQGRVLISVEDKSAVPESVAEESNAEVTPKEPLAEAISEEQLAEAISEEQLAEAIPEAPPAEYIEAPPAQVDEDKKVTGGEVAAGDANKEESTAGTDDGTQGVKATGDVPEGDGQIETVAESDAARKDESAPESASPERQTQAEPTEPDSTRKT